MLCCNYEVEGMYVVDVNGWLKSFGGGYGFDNGYMLLWIWVFNLEVCLVYVYCEWLQVEFGECCVDQMVNEICNLCLYFNVYLMDQFLM